jgi:hypothetical protein
VWQFTTAPYELGLALTVKIRKAGTSTWVTVARPAVWSTAAARTTLRLPSRGTWHVLVIRPATLRCSSSSVVRTVRAV